ncbi:MAG TPA: P1 family peptidase [Bryobacteraceae bacterium]|nr:P1 family peptidase [Bryobacteraceae bacterium]
MNRRTRTPFAFCLLFFAFCFAVAAAPRPRARAAGVPLDGTPGPLNAITDVTGVEVGHSTIIRGDGKLVVGVGPVRTGVTAILPRGKESVEPVLAAWFSLNGNGEMTGTTWVEESGFLEGPVMITNTHSVGVVRDAVVKRRVDRSVPGDWWSLPVVAETWDGELNDINGLHVKPENAFEALDTARSGAVPEGNVGGGTGMICFGFKGGIGTASRKLDERAGGYTLGVLVQCNCGGRTQLRIAGIPVGLELQKMAVREEDRGSIIIVIATDAPLLPHQLKRLARRATMGLARDGSTSGNGSGDIFVAFSTANAGAAKETGLTQLTMLPNDRMNPLFEAVVQATEEAILNAMFAAETMVGVDNHKVEALPIEPVREILKRFNRLNQ